MHYKMLFLAAVIALAGCSKSIVEMREDGPLESFHSSKPEPDLSKCILFAWQNDSLAGVHYNVNLQPRPAGGQTVVNAGYREIADVYPSRGVTAVDFYSLYGATSWITDKRTKSIRECL